MSYNYIKKKKPFIPRTLLRHPNFSLAKSKAGKRTSKMYAIQAEIIRHHLTKDAMATQLLTILVR